MSAVAYRTATPSYKTVHWRLSRERGPASAHDCEDCGRPAEEWAFDEPTGHSDDLSRYAPLCCSCHARRDGRVERFPRRRKRR